MISNLSVFSIRFQQTLIRLSEADLRKAFRERDFLTCRRRHTRIKSPLGFFEDLQGQSGTAMSSKPKLQPLYSGYTPKLRE